MTYSSAADDAALSFCVPSMTIDLEVKVLSGVDRDNRSELQGEDRE